MSRSFFTHCFAVVFLMAAATALYGVKYKVQDVREEVQTAQRKLLDERKAMQVAAAEWAYLSRPDRLADLSEKYLGSAPVEAQQVHQVSGLPYPSAHYAAIDNARLPQSGVMAGGAVAVSAVMNAAPASIEGASAPILNRE